MTKCNEDEMKNMDKVATGKSWKNVPMTQSRSIKVNLSFTKSQFKAIKKGFIPQEMEDKWFIYFENNWLHLCRSWTGVEIYKAEIKERNQNHIIDEFFVAVNPAEYRGGDDDFEKNMFGSIITSHLLNGEFDMKMI